MSISFTGTNGLFTRWGRLGGLLNNLFGFLGSTAPSPSSAWGASGPTISAILTNVNNIRDQYVASDDTRMIDTLYSTLDAYRTVHSSLTSFLQTEAQTTGITMADADVKLASKDLTSALKEIIKQMKAGAQSVPAPTITATITAGSSNVGDGTATASVLDTDGKQLDYSFNENIDATCTSDNQVGATAGQEPFLALGDNAQSDPLQFDWPKGSGCSTQLTAIDSTVDASGNLLTNSCYELFTANVPNNWNVLVGTAGTTFQDGGSGQSYSGSHVLQIIGNGAELTSLAQTFAQTSGGTTSTLAPSTVYAVSLVLKVSSVPAAGVLEISLVDGTNTVINDAAGTANAFTKSLPAATTNYVRLNGYFRTPAVLPSTIKIRVRLSTALDNAKSVFVDHLAMAPATQLYAGGPFACVFSGVTKFITNDTFQIGIANNYGSAWQKLAERLFSMRSLGLKLPSSGGPTIADSLIA